MSVQAFYDELAPLYHLVYENWEASVARQGKALASLIGEHWGAGARTVLDAAVGIGTQALGLLALCLPLLTPLLNLLDVPVEDAAVDGSTFSSVLQFSSTPSRRGCPDVSLPKRE